MRLNIVCYMFGSIDCDYILYMYLYVKSIYICLEIYNDYKQMRPFLNF